MNPKKLIVVLEKRGLFLLVALTLVAFVLACLHTFVDPAGTTPSIWMAVRTTLTTSADVAEGWTLAMHILLKATIGWAAFRIYMATAGFKWDTFSARHLARKHIAITAGPWAGAMQTAGVEGTRAPVDKSAQAVELALTLATSNRVVLHLPGLEDGARVRLWEAGVTVVGSDLPAPQLLKAIGASRARWLIAMRDRYAENIVLARAATSPTLGNAKLECRCMIEPLVVKSGFKLEDYLEPEALSRVRAFNEAELIARRLLRDHPPDAPVAVSDHAVHLLLVGLGSIGQAILLQLARIGHYRSGLRPKVTALDRKACARWEETLRAHPPIGELLDVQTVEARIESVSDGEIDRWLAGDHAPTMIYVCTKDELANLRIARALLQRLRERQHAGGPPAPKIIALDPPGGCVLGDFARNGANTSDFHLFSLIASYGKDGRSSKSGSVLMELDDRLARRVHEAYCADDNARCAADPRATRAIANQPWEKLPETFRESNRASADHFEVKLRAVGRRIAASGATQAAPLTTEEIELLARMEHERWCAERLLGGWSLGSPRDDGRKLHPDLLPWEQLDNGVKQKDRNNVVAMVDIATGSEQVLALDSPRDRQAGG